VLFSSPEFILLFLPITLAVHRYLARTQLSAGMLWLVFMSFVFYGWWQAAGIILLAAVILFNFWMSQILQSQTLQLGSPGRFLFAGVATNLLILFYFKYAAFFSTALYDMSGVDWRIRARALPLGISFFTFTQIAFLVDVYSERTQEKSLKAYSLFVSFFPHLIAGPIVHHRQIMPQFAEQPKRHDLDVGLMIFCIGLAKKVVIADSLSSYANSIFSAASHGVHLSLLEGWVGVLVYTFQLYFDFSGYSDMAIGMARMFGIRFPANFDSPYKVGSIIEFWRCWHMTLSAFLRDYLFQPLALAMFRLPLKRDRRGTARRYASVFITMLLGGLWHGANWTFIAWGAYHGALIMINHAIRDLFGAPKPRRFIYAMAFRGVTFLLVAIGFVFFRSDSIASASSMLFSLIGGHGVDQLVVPARLLHAGSVAGSMWIVDSFPNHLFQALRLAPWLLLAAIIAFGLPNTQQIMGQYAPVLTVDGDDDRTSHSWLTWRPTFAWSIANTTLFLASAVAFLYNLKSDFIYYIF
jgi:alginate O-acetyltransferase complex protein AlgI